MKLVVQRVTSASVEVEGEIVGEIDEGLMVLVGFGENDTTREADYLAGKLAKLRIQGSSSPSIHIVCPHQKEQAFIPQGIGSG